MPPPPDFATLVRLQGDRGNQMDDEAEIRRIIERQFASLCWTPAASADWAAFAGDFMPGATLYPAARPLQAQTPDAFLARMKGVAAKIATFQEDPLGITISVFGNVAIAAAGCRITENGTAATRGAEMMLFVKDDGRWRIAAQAWDTEGDGRTLPAALAGEATREET
ncbi:MAG TPA: DUF4440 domain-containing protein [Pseudolabrys sp.]|nr:DUF4440 domain-containing protein [Pseudolabrys sp.]